MNKIAIVTTYPRLDLSDMNESALSWYSKKLVDIIPTKSRKNFIVLANQVSKEVDYYDNGVFIKRCWKRNSLSFFYQLIKSIREEGIRVVHLQHEFNLFGTMSTIPFVLILFFMLKLFRIRLIVTFHGVISQKVITGNFNQTNQIKYPNWLLRLFFFVFYYLSSFFINDVVVHEKYFKDVLIKEYRFNSKKIDIIPIGIEKKKKDKNQDVLKKSLGVPKNKKILLFFGFLAGYKGINLLLDAFKMLNEKEYFLLICGGKPKRVEKNKEYNDWFKNVKKRISNNHNIMMTGFVPEEDVIKYFSVADLLVIPYLQMLASSGPMAISISYGVPFIASDLFSDIWGDEICFKLDPKELSLKIQGFFDKDENNKNKIADIVNKARKEREWSKLWPKYEMLYFG